MTTDVMMPDLSTLDYIMEKAILMEWFKKEGESVKKGEPLFKIMSEKAVMEIEAPASGILKSILVREGAEAPPATKLASIE